MKKLFSNLYYLNLIQKEIDIRKKLKKSLNGNNNII